VEIQFFLIVAIWSRNLKNEKVQGLNLHQIISSADLGGSSNYSKETNLRKLIKKN